MYLQHWLLQPLLKSKGSVNLKSTSLDQEKSGSKKTISHTLKSMSISLTISVKKSIFPSTDLHVLPKMVNAILQDLESTDVKMSKHGNGGMQMRSINNMLQVFYHHLQEEKSTLVMPRRKSSGPTLVILDRLLLTKFMDQKIKLLLLLLPTLQLIKSHSLLTSNLLTHITGSHQVKMIPMVAVRFKPGNFHSVSMVKSSRLPELLSSKT